MSDISLFPVQASGICGRSDGINFTEVKRMTIRELRAREKMSQTAFAKRIGITPGTVSQLENGRMKISDRIADRIWDEFGTEVGEMAENKPVKKTKASKLEIYVQSPMGGNITPEEILAKMPEGVEACFVRIDQNLIWWVRGEETGAVEIWPDDR
jgi:transcriptional regulator with XRE-family HTH domain